MRAHRPAHHTVTPSTRASKRQTLNQVRLASPLVFRRKRTQLPPWSRTAERLGPPSGFGVAGEFAFNSGLAEAAFKADQDLVETQNTKPQTLNPKP